MGKDINKDEDFLEKLGLSKEEEKNIIFIKK